MGVAAGSAQVWSRRPSDGGVKQNVSVTSKSSSLCIRRSNHAVAFGRCQSAQLKPVRSSRTPNDLSRSTA